jgi:Coenzyme PQQ synthesis protein D (PqqD)
MTASRCVVPSRDVVVRSLNGERVLLNLRNGNCYGLDLVGASVWEQLEAGRTLEWLAGFVSGKFELDPDHGMSDLISFTQDLREHGLIDVV